MTRAILLGAAGAVVSAAMLAGGFLAGKPSQAAAKDSPPAMTVASAETLDRKAVENIVREYLLANPELLLEVQKALDTKQKEEQRVANLKFIQDNKDKIFSSANDGIFGNPNGKITMVEFFDYNCGYCKRAMEDMRALTAADPELRFVLKEFPILGPDSQKASVVSMAFHKMMPEKYAEFHSQLLGIPGRAGEARRHQDCRLAWRRRGEAARGDERPLNHRDFQRDLRTCQQAVDHRHAILRCRRRNRIRCARAGCIELEACRRQRSLRHGRLLVFEQLK